MTPTLLQAALLLDGRGGPPLHDAAVRVDVTAPQRVRFVMARGQVVRNDARDGDGPGGLESVQPTPRAEDRR